ncbi:MAG: CRISPR-associated endonuclease Cas2 [bacterium]|nr:CRISPR-associated endonuclease Cas2 [bacterium]
MSKTTLSRTKQLLCAMHENLQEVKQNSFYLLVGTMHPLYHRTFHGGGFAAVGRRLAWEQNALLRRLEQQKWVHVKRIGDRMRCTLTEKGRRIALKEHMRNATACKKNECVIVVFDIPEREKRIRQQFRSLLKECGFQQLQRSVWMSRCDVLDALRTCIRSTKSEEWIRAFRVVDMV